jgi:MFS transporter, OFA family, oxalate/formate antiporter
MWSLLTFIVIYGKLSLNQKRKAVYMKKWASLFAGVVLQAILGSVYAWSVFSGPLAMEHGISVGRSGLVFGVTIAVFSLAAVFAGRMLQRKGPKLTAGAGALLFGAGYLIASISNGNFFLILAGIGIVSGAGLGFGYVCPLSAGMKWFPERKGLITGICVAGFGGGAVILSALAEKVLFPGGASALDVFRFIGAFYGGLALISALVLSEPRGSGRNSAPELGCRRHIFSACFGRLCLGMFGGTFAGLLVIGNLKPMALAGGAGESAAALSIPLFAAGNVAGRVLWGGIHDRLGSRRTVLLSLGALGVSLVLLALNLPGGLFLLPVFLAGAGFGGCFVVYASSVAEIFGAELFPSLYPFCFLFYGLAALAGPPAGGFLFEASGSYAGGLALSIAVVIFAASALFFSPSNLWASRNNCLPESGGGV